MKLIKLIGLVGLLAFVTGVGKAQTQPVPDTYISTGVISNFTTPYNIAPYGAAATLITPSSGPLPTYAGMRYELYRDAKGNLLMQDWLLLRLLYSIRIGFFCLLMGLIGGAGGVNDISSVLQIGGGVGIQIGKYSLVNTPHWEFVFEPQARRIPALANGTNPALLVGVVYSFNKPK